MSIEHDITYRFQTPGSSSFLTVTRQIVAAASNNLDTQIPNGSANLPAAFALTLAKVQSIYLYCDQAVTLSSGGTSAVQQVAITGTPTGGTFTLTFGGHTTTAIPFNAIASAVQTPLQALSSIGTSGVTCTGGPLPGTPVVCAFAGPLAIQTVTLMTHTDSLTGGSTPAVGVTTTTPGVAPDTTLAILANVPLVWDSAAYFAQPFNANVSTLYVTNASGVGANLHLRTLSNQ